MDVFAPPSPRLAMTAALFGVLLAVLYAGVFAEMAFDWWDDANYSHGFLVPVFSAYLAWQQRERLRSLPVDGSWAGLAVLLAGLGMLMLGTVGSEYFLTRSSFVVILAGLTLFHAGWAVFRVLAFPIGFLFLMVPLPTIIFNAIAFPLQGIAAQNATWALDVMGIPVLRDGNVIHLSHTTLGITEACSGIRSLISLIALAVVWAYLAIPGLIAGTLFVATAVPITIIANAGRIVSTGIIAQEVGIEYAQGFFHGFSGWVIFLVAFACLLGVHGILMLLGRLGRRGEA